MQVFEKLGNLSVTPFFVKSGSYPENKTELKGKKNTDAPLGSDVYFENSIAGSVIPLFTWCIFLLLLDSSIHVNNALSKHSIYMCFRLTWCNTTAWLLYLKQFINVLGHVSSYKIEFEDGSFSKEFEDTVFSHTFNEVKKILFSKNTVMTFISIDSKYN